MLATQLNDKMKSGEMDNLSIVQVKQYICNTLTGDRRVIILLEIDVIAKGAEVGSRLGNPQPLKSIQADLNPAATSGAQSNPLQSAQLVQSNPPPQSKQIVQPKPSLARPTQVTSESSVNGLMASPPPNKSGYNIKAGAANGTPNFNRIHSIASLTPYQNRWRIRARVTQKSNIRTWSNSRGEGKLFSLNLIDESGEIKATGFTDTVDKFYNLLEVNKVYYISKANLKTANKQYSSLTNDYEMTLNADTLIEPCEEQTDLPTMTFDFVKINELESKQLNAVVDILGILKEAHDVCTVTGRQSHKEISKRDIQLVDQSGMVINLTLWGTDAENFKADGNPVLACKGCRLSDWGGRSLSLLSGSQMIMNPDIREAHLIRGWWLKEGSNQSFQSYKSEGGSAGSGSASWKTFGQVKNENIGSGEKPDYFTSKGTVVFLRKENSMYMACPTDQCNKKVVDQGNGMFRCEKCNKEFPNYKWRMILNANLADHTGNQWITCFQDSAECLLGVSADELGRMKSENETRYDQIFSNATFKEYIFKLRAKVETFNEESRLKTVCTSAAHIDWVEDGKRLLQEINTLLL